MKICFFHLMPYRFLPDDFETRYRSVWVDVPHSLYDAEKCGGLYYDGDRANPVVYAEDWQRRIKGAALRLLPGGHMVLHEAPEAAAAAVAEFLGP